MSVLKTWCQRNKSDDHIILYHAASLGEFEHLKPIFLQLKQKYSVKNVVTLFSPSGYDHAKNVKDVDLILYMPFDRSHTWTTFYRTLRPKMLIISKHDVWPQQLWSAKRLRIPAFLINASLTNESSRLQPGIRQFLKRIYHCFTRIYAISKEDAKRLSESFDLNQIITAGDTKYDQVISRKLSGEKESLIEKKWYENKFIFIGGSIWPKDLEHLIPACLKSLTLSANIRLILAPHQPEEKIIRNISEAFTIWGVAKFSDPVLPETSRVLVVDSVGNLATLYKYANIAYIGGSFSQGIHNVMEAAAYGIPILYGPAHKNSYEAVKLQENSGGIVVHNSDDIYYWLALFYHNVQERKHIGQMVAAYVNNNTGAVERIITDFSAYLEEK